jgi:hypothetical protein
MSVKCQLKLKCQLNVSQTQRFLKTENVVIITSKALCRYINYYIPIRDTYVNILVLHRYTHRISYIFKFI